MKNDKTYLEISKMTKEEVLSLYHTKEEGLSVVESERRLEEYGKNIPNDTKEKSVFYFIFESFRDKFILVLLTFLTIGATILIPILLSSVPGFNYVILPLNYYLYVVGLALVYMIIVKFVKRYYINKYHEWL